MIGDHMLYILFNWFERGRMGLGECGMGMGQCYLEDTRRSHMCLTVSRTPGVEGGGEVGRAYIGEQEKTLTQISSVHSHDLPPG